MEIYALETVHGKLPLEGHIVLYLWHTNGVQMGLPTVSY